MLGMQDTTRTEPKNATGLVLPGNEATFEIYRVWKSLPAISLKGVTREVLFQQAGIDDELVLEVLDIKTQAQFAAKYDLNPGTLSEWNKKIDDLDPLIEAKGWARKLAKNMVMALYAHALRKGDPALMKLFFQVVSEWSEKSTVEHDFPQVTEFNISIAAPKKDAETKTEGQASTDKLGNDAPPGGSVPVPTGPGN